MTSKSVDPIYWQYPVTAVSPARLLHNTSVSAEIRVQQAGSESCTFCTPAYLIAYRHTQGNIEGLYKLTEA